MYRILSILIILAAGVFIAYRLTMRSQKLPIYGPSDLNPELVDRSLRDRKRIHRISDFRLVCQTGDTITQEALDGKIYVADFFFTTCQSICPLMTGQMHRAYMEFSDNPHIMFVSHTVIPESDSVSALASYADQRGITSNRWLFLTGEKEHIYELARKSYFAVLDKGDGGPDDFIHTENFILVDKEKRIRGMYDGTSEKEVDRMMDEIRILLREYSK